MTKATKSHVGKDTYQPPGKFAQPGRPEKEVIVFRIQISTLKTLLVCLGDEKKTPRILLDQGKSLADDNYPVSRKDYRVYGPNSVAAWLHMGHALRLTKTSKDHDYYM